jgi:hypothetical protein
MTTNRRIRQVGKTQYKSHMQTHPGEVRRADQDWGNDKDYGVRVTP